MTTNATLRRPVGSAILRPLQSHKPDAPEAAEACKVQEADGFWNPNNIAHLERIWADMKAGRCKMEYHDLIEVEDDA